MVRTSLAATPNHIIFEETSDPRSSADITQPTLPATVVQSKHACHLHARCPCPAPHWGLFLCIGQDALNLRADLAQVVLERPHVFKLPVRLGLLDERLEKRFLLQQWLQDACDLGIGVDDLVLCGCRARRGWGTGFLGLR